MRNVFLIITAFLLIGCLGLETQLPLLSRYELYNLSHGKTRELKDKSHNQTIGFLGVTTTPKLATNGIIYKNSHLSFDTYAKNVWAQNPDKMLNALLLEKAMQTDLLLTQSSVDTSQIPLARLVVLEFSHNVMDSQVNFRAIGEYSSQTVGVEQINITHNISLEDNNIQNALEALNTVANRGLDEFLEWLSRRGALQE